MGYTVSDDEYMKHCSAIISILIVLLLTITPFAGGGLCPKPVESIEVWYYPYTFNLTWNLSEAPPSSIEMSANASGQGKFTIVVEIGCNVSTNNPDGVTISVSPDKFTLSDQKPIQTLSVIPSLPGLNVSKTNGTWINFTVWSNISSVGIVPRSIHQEEGGPYYILYMTSPSIEHNKEEKMERNTSFTSPFVMLILFFVLCTVLVIALIKRRIRKG